MGGSALNYIKNYFNPGKDILFKKLAEMGFDVWFANNSGTIFSMEHDVYTYNDKEFWAIDDSIYVPLCNK